MSVERLRTSLSDRYTIERELGAGGMATVYLAHDIKHDRDVAIKVLHPDLGAALGSDRFLSEIRTTARLQHPHILPLLDSGDANGLLYYVMPVVTGETLRARLTREQLLPIPDAVRIAREVASALDYAHRQGVIHRDIKPENILLHDGQALVADFGIALAVQTAGGTRMTQTGLSLGTPQYMSPEQAMGEKQIDARTDVYALGAVTYEMLVGEPPFTGPTVQAIVAKVLSERPTSPHTIRDTVPPGIEQTVLTALAKLPADRFPSAAEFAKALIDDSGHARVSRDERSRSPALVSRLSSLAVLAVVAIAGLWGWLRRPAAPRPSAEIKVPIVLRAPISLIRGAGMAVSPDGSKLAAFALDSAGAPTLFIQSLTDLTIPAIRLTAPTSALAFSAAGNALAYIMDRELWTVSLDGGSQRRIASVAVSRGIAWGPDSSIVAATSGGLLRIAMTGHVDTIADPLDSAGYRSPSFAARDLIVMEIGSAQGANQLAAMSLRDHRVIPLGINGIKPTVVDGHILTYFLADGTAWGIEFDPRKIKTSGAPKPITSQVSLAGAARPMAAIGSNGTMVYLTGVVSGDRELVLVDRTGHARPLSSLRRAWRFPRFSPGGKQVAVTVEGATGVVSGDLWVFGTDGSGPLRVTNDASSYQAEWDPDGRTLIYPHRLANGNVVLMRARADGTSGAEQLLARKSPIYESQITPDRRTIIWREDTYANNRDIFFAPIDSMASARPLLASTFDEKGLALSPDGHWLAYASNESNGNEVYLRRLEPNSPRWPVSSHGGAEPRWAGNEIFYRRGDTVFSARVTLGTTPQIGTPTPLFVGTYTFTNYEPLWDVSADGRQFAMVRPVTNATPQVVLYLNWAAHW